LEEPADIIFRIASLLRVEAEVPPKQWYVHQTLHNPEDIHNHHHENIKYQTTEQFWK
jgi:hypothetical protein